MIIDVCTYQFKPKYLQDTPTTSALFGQGKLFLGMIYSFFYSNFYITLHCFT